MRLPKLQQSCHCLCRNVNLVRYEDASSGSTLEYWNRFRALGSPLPNGAWRLRPQKFQTKVQEWLAKEPFDALTCDDIYVPPNIPARPGLPIVLNKLGIGTVIFERFLWNEQTPLKNIYGLLKTRRWRAPVCNHAALIMACSEQERSEIDPLSSGATATIVLNVIDVRQYEQGPHV